jgi:hypothetical protein
MTAAADRGFIPNAPDGALCGRKVATGFHSRIKLFSSFYTVASVSTHNAYRDNKRSAGGRKKIHISSSRKEKKEASFEPKNDYNKHITTSTVHRHFSY